MHCLRDVPACRANGYGVLKEVAGVGGASPTYDLAYTFDAAGNTKALALVDTSPAIDNVTVGWRKSRAYLSHGLKGVRVYRMVKGVN